LLNINIEIFYLIRLSKSEQEELDLALQLSKETNEISIELPIVTDDKESTTSQSTVSSHGMDDYNYR
jgi:hypothetical protein